MSQNLKSILIFIAVFIFLVIAGFNSVKYWDKQDKEIELTKAEQENNRVIDSLKLANAFKDTTIKNLLVAKEVEKTNRNNYASNKNKRDIEIYKAPADRNRDYNIQFLMGFEPKYR